MLDVKSLIYNYTCDDNEYYIMREDLLPFSFGGNKLRKNLYYFKEIISGDYTHVVSYGSKSSNHARIVANLCAKNGLNCTIVTPENNDKSTYNTSINETLNTNIVYTSVDRVKHTIDETIVELEDSGHKVYFIQGGGHGLLGTEAYIDAFKYIKQYSEYKDTYFDYIFLASGTGATQAGLVIGNYQNEYKSNIVGISIARNTSRGLVAIEESIDEYRQVHSNTLPNLPVKFDDSYLCGGYGHYGSDIKNIILNYYQDYGIPLDPTYTGKAVWGMQSYVKENNLKGKKILFIHTGGTPLFFDFLQENSYAKN